jgi:hypothetical protein
MGYILTAKHNFFPDEKDEEYTYESKKIKNNRLEITRELEKNNNINVFDEIYFLDFIENKSIDFSFLIVDLIENNIQDSVPYLEIEDLVDINYDIHNQIFFIYGYPNISSERVINKIHPYSVKYSQNTIDNSYFYKEEFYDYHGA